MTVPFRSDVLRAALGVATLLVPCVLPAQAQKRAITFADFTALRSVSDPQVSPDGRQVLYSVRVTDLDANRRLPSTYIIPITGGTARAFPHDTVRASEARWSPDGASIAYVAGGQLWIASSSGASPRRLTSLNGGASGPVWSPTGRHLGFVSAVYPDCADDACNAAKDKAKEENKVKARVTDQLLYRHWTSWDEGTRSHLFVISPAGDGLADLTRGARYDVPPPPFGGSEGYSFSPDGAEIAYTAKDAGREDAWSTDLNIYTVPVSGGTPKVITAANTAADQNPVYSPDGHFIAYASQQRPMFEADRWRLTFYERVTGAIRDVLPNWDRNAETYFFAPDTRAMFIGTGDQGRDRLFRLTLGATGLATSAPAALVSENNNTSFSRSADGRTLVWMQDAIHRPGEVFARVETGTGRNAQSQVVQVTHENDARLAALSLNAAEDFWFSGAQGDSVHGFLVKPPNWREGQQYPVVFLIHGGPQGAWLDNWGGRWSFQLFASTGAAVVAINPRGSTGYGQAFTDGVTQDWGGKAYEDLMKGLDAALVKYPWLDSTRMAAAGGSFGGYMVNWMAGHTDRFKALVSHAGIFNLEHMYGATEEIWFTEWEMGGPFWKPKAMDENYRRWSPHLSAEKFKTPVLLIHGELDYRVPYYESVSMFTALQRQGIPSRFVVYPDEGHWILKPQNARLWYGEVLGWLGRWLGTSTTS
jgi:dipeptidyl aminopeptidase/acylaminoacyl peptidase